MHLCFSSVQAQQRHSTFSVTCSAMQVKVTAPNQEASQAPQLQQPAAHHSSPPTPSGSGQVAHDQPPTCPQPSTSEESAHNPLVCIPSLKRLVITPAHRCVMAGPSVFSPARLLSHPTRQPHHPSMERCSTAVPTSNSCCSSASVLSKPLYHAIHSCATQQTVAMSSAISHQWGLYHAVMKQFLPQPCHTSTAAILVVLVPSQ